MSYVHNIINESFLAMIKTHDEFRSSVLMGYPNTKSRWLIGWLRWLAGESIS